MAVEEQVDFEVMVMKAAAARRCSWSIPQENHPYDTMCQEHCVATARKMLEEAGVKDLIEWQENVLATMRRTATVDVAGASADYDFDIGAMFNDMAGRIEAALAICDDDRIRSSTKVSVIRTVLMGDSHEGVWDGS